MTVFELDHLEQPHDRREFDGNRDAMNLAIIDLQHLDLSLPQQRDRFLPMQHPQRLVGRIQE